MNKEKLLKEIVTNFATSMENNDDNNLIKKGSLGTVITRCPYDDSYEFYIRGKITGEDLEKFIKENY